MKASALLLALLVVLGLGCNRDPAGQTLLVAGSGVLHGYLEPVVEAFNTKNPKSTVLNEEGGSAAAIIALKRGAIGVAGTGRDLLPEEDEMAMRGYLVAREGLVIVVNPRNPISEISLDHLTHVFDRHVTSWKDLPEGGDGAITVLVRDKVDARRHRPSTARRAFDSRVMSGDDPAKGSQFVGTADEMKEAIKKNPLAIGYLMLRDLTPEVKALTVEGVAPSRVTVLSERYPLTSSYYLVVMRPSKLGEQFVSFVLSKEGQELLKDQGLIPAF